MNDLISRNALIERLEISEKCSECRWADGMYCKKYDMFASACEAIYDAPTIEAIPVDLLINELVDSPDVSNDVSTAVNHLINLWRIRQTWKV